MALRKLQTEIDKVLKKVAEGVEDFEEIFEKIHATTNLGQKEKYEMNLKVEIKKLQRYRDQIKTWIQASEIKDKTLLMENRKLIETQMERFKAIEKELKTKQYSKEGLLAAAKVDPMEQEKSELSFWISETKDKLSTQIDALEAEAESLQSKKGRGKGKNERTTQIEHRVERHKHHIAQLDIIQRMLDNGKTSVEAIRGIQEDVNHYVESNQEDEFEEDEGVYDDLNLQDAEEIFGIANNEEDESDVEDDDSKPEETSPVVISPVKVPPPKTPSIAPRQVPPSLPVTPVVPAAAPKEDAKVTKTSGSLPRPTPTRMTPDSTVPQSTVKYAAVLASSSNQPAAEQQSTTRGSTPTPAPSHLVSQLPPPAEEKKATAKRESASAPPIQQAQTPAQGPPPPQPSSQTQTPVANLVATPSESGPAKTPSMVTAPLAASESQPKEEPAPAPINNQLPPSVADLVSSFAIARDRSQKIKEDPSWLQAMLTNSAEFAPEPLDVERPKYYFPKNSYPTPSYYPQLPLHIFDNPAVYEEFDLDTLFFIFYYQQGTYQQYLAARELKRQSWRFHKRYLTWFQRHEEPKAITEEYEQGAYIYFDFEGSWCQRKKNDFRFDYRWLEDEVF